LMSRTALSSKSPYFCKKNSLYATMLVRHAFSSFSRTPSRCLLASYAIISLWHTRHTPFNLCFILLSPSFSSGMCVSMISKKIRGTSCMQEQRWLPLNHPAANSYKSYNVATPILPSSQDPLALSSSHPHPSKSLPLH
jgi:hypothetical protein